MDALKTSGDRANAALASGGSLTVADVAVLLSISEKTVREMVASGELPAFRIGNSRMIRIRVSDFQALWKPYLGGR